MYSLPPGPSRNTSAVTKSVWPQARYTHTHMMVPTTRVTAACGGPVHHRHTPIYIYDVQPQRFQRLRLVLHTVSTPATSSRESMLARQTAGVRLSWLTGVQTLPTHLPTYLTVTLVGHTPVASHRGISEASGPPLKTQTATPSI